MQTLLLTQKPDLSATDLLGEQGRKKYGPVFVIPESIYYKPVLGTCSQSK